MAESRKIIEHVVLELQKQGWRTRLGKHIVLYPPDKTKKPVSISYTPGDNRWQETMFAKLRRAGAHI